MSKRAVGGLCAAVTAFLVVILFIVFGTTIVEESKEQSREPAPDCCASYHYFETDVPGVRIRIAKTADPDEPPRTSPDGRKLSYEVHILYKGEKKYVYPLWEKEALALLKGAEERKASRLACLTQVPCTIGDMMVCTAPATWTLQEEPEGQ